MASQDQTPPRRPPPPREFSEGQARARRRKARKHRSSASGSQLSEDTSQAGSSDAGVSDTTAHNLETIDETVPAREPDEQPQTGYSPQQEDKPILDHQQEAIPLPERQHEPTLPGDLLVEPEPLPRRQGDVFSDIFSNILSVLNPRNENTQDLIGRTLGNPTPRPQVDGVPTVEPGGPGLTQNNTQHNTHNQHTFNITLNQNTYESAEGSSGGGGGGGGGRGGRRSCFPSLPFCTLPLMLVILAILLVGISALYGVVTAWTNTANALYQAFATLTSYVSFGYWAWGSPPQPTGPTPITIITVAPVPTPDPTPALLAHAPHGFAKAIDDVDNWMRKLKANPDIETHLANDDFFFSGHEAYDSIAFVGIGGIRDVWVILAHDIGKIEKDIINFFGPLDRDISHLLKHLRSRPATARCLQEARSSGFWNRFLEWIWWTRSESSLDIIHKNLGLAISLHSRARLARQVFPLKTYTNIHRRLSDLKQATCRLRNSVETSGQGVSRKNNIGKGIAAVVNRANILCNKFQETEQRVVVMDELIKYLANPNRDGEDLEKRVAPLGAMKTRPATQIRIVEEEIEEWVAEIAESVGKLRRLDLD